MWPLISSLRIASACSAASSGVSANLTPPAFIRPPLSTCDLITTGPPISSAAPRASSAVLQKPYLVTGIPASSTIFRASYSKKRMRGAEPYLKGGCGKSSHRYCGGRAEGASAHLSPLSPEVSERPEHRGEDHQRQQRTRLVRRGDPGCLPDRRPDSRGSGRLGRRRPGGFAAGFSSASVRRDARSAGCMAAAVTALALGEGPVCGLRGRDRGRRRGGGRFGGGLAFRSLLFKLLSVASAEHLGGRTVAGLLVGLLVAT